MNQTIHNTNEFKFEIITGTEAETTRDCAHLDYEMIDENTVNFTHTFVPFRQRGQGHAETLVKAGLDWARENKLLIRTSCWYVEKYMAEHSQ
jgi:predicted GNAT family acetyltransferase